MRADQTADNTDGPKAIDGKGVVLNRNDLLQEILKQSKAGK